MELEDDAKDVYFYTGQSFRIRETRASDLSIWYKWFNDPEVTHEMIHGIVPNTIEKQEDFRRSHIDGESKIIFSIIARDSPELIGTCSINVHGKWLHGRAEISIVLGHAKYRRGPIYMEVTAWQVDHSFCMMNMHSVFSVTSETNKVVIATLERLGFSKVGVLREGSYRNGTYHNSVMQDILHDEWMVSRPQKILND